MEICKAGKSTENAPGTEGENGILMGNPPTIMIYNGGSMGIYSAFAEDDSLNFLIGKSICLVAFVSWKMKPSLHSGPGRRDVGVLPDTSLLTSF